MENKEYKDMDKGELWKEISTLIQATHFIEEDKNSFANLIQEYSFRK